jgi:hypothetical protein
VRQTLLQAAQIGTEAGLVKAPLAVHGLEFLVGAAQRQIGFLKMPVQIVFQRHCQIVRSFLGRRVIALAALVQYMADKQRHDQQHHHHRRDQHAEELAKRVQRAGGHIKFTFTVAV